MDRVQRDIATHAKAIACRNWVVFGKYYRESVIGAHRSPPKLSDLGLEHIAGEFRTGDVLMTNMRSCCQYSDESQLQTHRKY